MSSDSKSRNSVSSDNSSNGKTQTEALAVKVMPSPWSCLGGAAVAGGIATVLYRLTIGIAQLFASQPTQSHNLLVQRITAAVRTMFIGLSAMGTGIFALAALGLFGLGIQLLLQRPQAAAPQNSQGEPPQGKV